MDSIVLTIASWLGSVNPNHQHEQLNESGWYYDDITVNDGAINGLIDAKLGDHQMAQTNLLLGAPY
ncbi:hypothetical protein F3J29_18080 [Enterobacter sp. Cy-643]|uniref:hypothetical protein n=1 Tax=Enterobacter sp. Cy-643 TaxID=2608346 RepID=UPI001423AE3B|nr:hypothetical protein [Enterobacter sp. Cy-643]NIF34041.1 hypothetical protein [Enterobacter sp. Cy-643]